VAYPGKAKLTNPTHEILVLLLKTGERFVVDVTAAQFGFSEVVAPWQDYVDQRAESYGIFQRSGLQETATYGCMKQDHEAGGLINQVSINGYLAEFWLREFVHDTLVQWLLEKDSTASKVMLLPEEDFQTACKDGEEHLSKKIDGFLASTARKGTIWEAARKANTMEKLVARVNRWSEGVSEENLDLVLGLFEMVSRTKQYGLPRV
jgi:hypothetical protein